MAARNKSSVISLTRVYDAPLQAVWEAWTNPEEVQHWWGPRGFTLTTHSHDLRTGGNWHYTMHGPDGTDYENTTQYLEVVPGQRMVYDHGGHKDRPPLFRVTALFTERNGRTQLDMSMTFATPEVAEQTRGFIRKAGGDGTWDRLAEYLGKHRAGQEQFFITRTFDAGIEQVYEMWSNPEPLGAWLPPTGSTMRFLRAELHVGGTSFYAMTRPDGGTMYGLIKYIALEKPHRIAYTQQFCDEHQRVIRPPFFKDWPLAMLSTIELVAESPERTRVRVRWEPQDATAADIAEFVKQRGGMTMGWTGSFDKLEALLGG
jgi:uncharacterized protein YndB with AHSA1/START domain